MRLDAFSARSWLRRAKCLNAESGDCMRKRTAYFKIAKNYLREMERRFQEAWNMGFDDAEAGRDQRPTPCPDEIKPGTTAYAAVAFARELYHMGYRAGKKANTDESV